MNECIGQSDTVPAGNSHKRTIRVGPIEILARTLTRRAEVRSIPIALRITPAPIAMKLKQSLREFFYRWGRGNEPSDLRYTSVNEEFDAGNVTAVI